MSRSFRASRSANGREPITLSPTENRASLGEALGGADELQAFDYAPVQLDHLVFGQFGEVEGHTVRGRTTPRR
jgi:hypothetical protein